MQSWTQSSIFRSDSSSSQSHDEPLSPAWLLRHPRLQASEFKSSLGHDFGLQSRESKSGLGHGFGLQPDGSKSALKHDFSMQSSESKLGLGLDFGLQPGESKSALKRDFGLQSSESKSALGFDLESKIAALKRDIGQPGESKLAALKRDLGLQPSGSKSALGLDFGLHQSNSRSTLARDLGLPPASIPCNMRNDDLFTSSVLEKRCDVDVDVVCEARPSFEKGPNGTFVMNLSGINVKVTTTCSPSPVLLSGVALFKPHEAFCITCPEMHEIVFDPRSGDSASLCGSISVSKRLTVLDLTKEHSLDAKLNTDAPRGRLTIEDTHTVGHQRQMVSEASLHWEVVANGRLSLENDGGCRVHADFDFEFRYRLEGSFSDLRERLSDLHSRFQQPTLSRPTLNGGSGFSQRLESTASDISIDLPRTASRCGSDFSQRQESMSSDTHSVGRDSSQSGFGFSQRQGRVSFDTESSRTNNESLDRLGSGEGRSSPAEIMRRRGRCFTKKSQAALSELSNTEDELEHIEQNVAEIANVLQKEVDATEALRMKNTLSQLEAKAKALETKGIDGIYTSELTSGKQLAKDSKKDMLRRLEELFSQMDDCFTKIKAKHA